MKMLLLLGIVALCAYLYLTQTAQSAKEAAAKEQATAEAAEKAAVAAARPSATPAPARGSALTSGNFAPPAANGSTPAPKPGDWMWQKATPDPKQRKR